MLEFKNTLVNALHPHDYEDIQEGMSVAKQAVEVLLSQGCPIVIACDQRWWEYGTAIQMMINHFGKDKLRDVALLDVGSGWSGFGPSMSYTFDTEVSEYEPVAQYRNDRSRTNDVLHRLGKRGTYVHDFALETMPAQDYDVVCCISVLEHVGKATERQCWKNLGDRVRKNGLLFIDVDIVEDNTKPHIYDEMRVMPNYTLQDMKERVEMLVSECGMTTIGTPDYEWNGNQVHDFTFFRAGFIKL